MKQAEILFRKQNEIYIIKEHPLLNIITDSYWILSRYTINVLIKHILRMLKLQRNS